MHMASASLQLKVLSVLEAISYKRMPWLSMGVSNVLQIKFFDLVYNWKDTNTFVKDEFYIAWKYKGL